MRASMDQPLPVEPQSDQFVAECTDCHAPLREDDVREILGQPFCIGCGQEQASSLSRSLTASYDDLVHYAGLLEEWAKEVRRSAAKAARRDNERLHAATAPVRVANLTLHAGGL